MVVVMRSFFLLCAICVTVLAQYPPQPENINSTGTSILNHDSPISGFWGQTFLKENIPYIDIPDSNIQDVYYYRWSTLARHIRYTIAGTGYILTEFCQPVGYAEAFNTIDAAAGHQIDEARWLRSSFYDDDYISVYTRGPGNSTQYTQWILDASYRRSQVDGDTTFTTDQLSDMVRLWHLWDYTFDTGVGLFYFTPEFDAQEYSLPGYVDPVPATHPDAPQYGGPNTYRPNINAYMVANARAISNVASESGETSVAANFSATAAAIEAAIFAHLWDPVQEFFVDVIRPNNTNLTKISGREEVGLFPYRFAVGLAPKYSKPAIAELFDPNGVYAPYGPTTLEQRNQYFTAQKPTDYCCYWQGQSWPYSTAHTLKSLAAIHRSTNASATADQYYQYLSIYATTQHKSGVPYVAESHYPLQDAWSADTSNHSEHYDHSTNNDDVITGLLGIIPRSDNNLEIDPIIPSNWTYFAIENLAYHGHLISVFYDTTGSRYNLTSGLTVFVDGSKTYHQPPASSNTSSPYALVSLPSGTASTSSSPTPVNIASNPLGPSTGAYSRINATYTYYTDDPYKAIDGYLFYDSIPDNRWTNYQSPNQADSLTITLPRARNFSSVTLAIYSDIARGGGIDVPAAIQISVAGLNGIETVVKTVNGSDSFAPNDRNTFLFDQGTVTSDTVSISFTNQPGYYVGVCEAEIWVPDATTTSQVYYAVDALLTDAAVVVGSNGSDSVVGGLSSGSTIAFSGVRTADGTAKMGQPLSIRYMNTGNSTVMLEVLVNQVGVGNVSLVPATGLADASLVVDLGGGKNFVSLVGGSDGVAVESIAVGS